MNLIIAGDIQRFLKKTETVPLNPARSASQVVNDMRQALSRRSHREIHCGDIGGLSGAEKEGLFEPGTSNLISNDHYIINTTIPSVPSIMNHSRGLAISVYYRQNGDNVRDLSQGLVNAARCLIVTAGL